MVRLAAIALLCTTVVASAAATDIHVLRSIDREVITETVVRFDEGAAGIFGREVWRSPAGIVCTVSAFRSEGVTGGMLDCLSKSRHQAQISWNCRDNKNIDSAAYLFFAKIDSPEEVGNFYVWCE